MKPLDPNVFARNDCVTKEAVRAAIAQIIDNVQGNRTNAQLARICGCSDETIANAKYQRTTLDPVTMASLGRYFGVAQINPYLRLMYGRGVPLSPDETRIPDLVDCSHTLVATYIGAVHPDSPGGSRIVHTELAQIKSHAPRMAALAAGVGG